MKHVRENRKLLAPLRKAIGFPAIHTWTGNKAFNRTKGKKFGEMVLRLDDDEFKAFLSAIGWVEINWALMEQQLDRWLHIIYEELGGRALRKEVPLGFAAKSEYLKRAFKKIAVLAQFREAALSILERADRHAITRNDLTHAVITSMRSKDGKFTLINFKLRKDGTYHTKDVVFKARAFPALGEELVLLGSDALDVTGSMVDAFGGR